MLSRAVVVASSAVIIITTWCWCVARSSVVIHESQAAVLSLGPASLLHLQPVHPVRPIQLFPFWGAWDDLQVSMPDDMSSSLSLSPAGTPVSRMSRIFRIVGWG